MRTCLASRAARACFAATLVLFLSFNPSFARMGGSFGRPGFGAARFSHFATHGFNQRFDAGRFSFNRFGPKRFDRFGFNRFNRFGFNRFAGNQLFASGWGWGGYSVPAATSEPIIVGDGAPVIINIGAEPAPADAGGAYAGGCGVIHKLNYDANGKYVGERQIPLC
jgi:hypothetical protein